MRDCDRHRLTQDFLLMVRERHGERLDAWIEASRQSELADCVGSRSGFMAMPPRSMPD